MQKEISEYYRTTDYSYQTSDRRLGQQIMFSSDPDRSCSKCVFEQKLSDDTSEELITHDERYTDDQSDDDAKKICPEQFIVLIGRYK